MHVALTTAEHEELLDGACVVTGQEAVFRIQGPGAVECMQGLLTNDLAAPGPQSLVYGALLTPKGMIVVDVWVVRLPDQLLLVCRAPARERTAELLRKALPPRLARVTDLTETWSVMWLLGSAVARIAASAGLSPFPEAGRVVPAGEDVVLAAGTRVAPFAALLLGDAKAMGHARALLLRAGAAAGDQARLEAARILSGWPAVGEEIDARTLPQEVRFDELQGVSYSKGCYTGQETVARVHFRGHVNRLLRGLVFEGESPLGDDAVVAKGKTVGTAHSAVSTEGRLLVLGMIRRELGPGDEVTVGDRLGRVVALPFDHRPGRAA